MNKIEGLVAAPFTPFDNNGNLNLPMVGPYAEMLARNGVRGVFVCGSNGEGQSMDLAERMTLAEAWIKESPSAMTVIVHVGTNALPDVKRLLKHAQQNGAAAAGLIAPSYHKAVSVAALADYFVDAVSVVPELPVYYYHMPMMTGATFAMIDLIETLASRCKNFAGIKYTDENLMDFSQCLVYDGRKYDMLFGRDEMLLSSMIAGARGAVGSTYNFAAPLYTGIIERFHAGDVDGANKLQQKSHTMIRELFRHGAHPIAAQKVAMKMIGIDCGGVRLPLLTPSGEITQKITTALEAIGFSEYQCR